MLCDSSNAQCDINGSVADSYDTTCPGCSSSTPGNCSAYGCNGPTLTATWTANALCPNYYVWIVDQNGNLVGASPATGDNSGSCASPNQQVTSWTFAANCTGITNCTVANLGPSYTYTEKVYTTAFPCCSNAPWYTTSVTTGACLCPAVPPPPTGLSSSGTCSGGGNASETLSWNAPNSSWQVSDYSVDLWTSANWTTVYTGYNCNATTCSTTPINNLLTSTTYSWRVRAYNPVGWGNYASSTFTTSSCPSSISGYVYVVNSSGTVISDYSGATLTRTGSVTTTSGGSGYYVFPSLAPGIYNVSLTVPAGYLAYSSTSQNASVPPNATLNFQIRQPSVTIQGHFVYPDNLGNVDDFGSPNGPTNIGQGATITNGANTYPVTLSGWGAYYNNSLPPANGYTVTAASVLGYTLSYCQNISANYCRSESNYISGSSVSGINLPSDGNYADIWFMYARKYTISGNVFLDNNKNGILDSGEGNYNSSTSSIYYQGLTNGTVTTGSGAYIAGSLPAGSYAVFYPAPGTNLPSGYNMTYPLNGPPAWFSLPVGPPCTPGAIAGVNNAQYDGSCNITGLDFGITNVLPWIQSTGTDIRKDGGYSYNIPPSSSSCGTVPDYASVVGASGTPGIIFSGDNTASFGSGQASQSPYNWVVGSASYPEVYSSPNGGVSTSYAYISSLVQQAGLTPVDLTTPTNYCGTGGLSSCNLSTATLPHGLYIANGSLTLTGAASYTFPSSQNYMILVHGDLTIKERIIVPVGSTATFIVSGNIYVDKSVGEASFTSANPDIQGFYSADNNFVVQGTNNCGAGADLRLNIAGAVVMNAARNGGTFQNQRDLCSGDASCPTISIQERPDLIINAPQILRKTNVIYQEVAP